MEGNEPYSPAVFACVSVHERILTVALLPKVVILYQAADGLVRQHGSDTLKVFAVVLEGLLKCYFVFHCPLIWGEGRREGGRKGGREGGREGGGRSWEGERDEGRDRGRKGGTSMYLHVNTCTQFIA